jgi:hypothetical protein
MCIFLELLGGDSDPEEGEVAFKAGVGESVALVVLGRGNPVDAPSADFGCE